MPLKSCLSEKWDFLCKGAPLYTNFSFARRRQCVYRRNRTSTRKELWDTSLLEKSSGRKAYFPSRLAGPQAHILVINCPDKEHHAAFIYHQTGTNRNMNGRCPPSRRDSSTCSTRVASTWQSPVTQPRRWRLFPFALWRSWEATEYVVVCFLCHICRLKELFTAVQCECLLNVIHCDVGRQRWRLDSAMFKWGAIGVGSH